MRSLLRLLFPAAVGLCGLLLAGPAAGADYLQVAGLIDTRTVFSDGKLSPKALARLAQSRGFEALFYNDHDRLVMAYGLFPLQHILRKRASLQGIHHSGADTWLAAIEDAAEALPDMILVPGVESVPYYYWTGSYFSGDLTAHDHEKRMLAVGLESPEDYENMPILHNGFSTRFFGRFLPQISIFAGALIIGIVLIREKRRAPRAVGIVICAGSVLLMINTMPFRSSPYDQYMGDLGIAPYQLYIDYVTSAGGMVFWNYPETRSGVRRLGPIQLRTPPYPDVLEKARGYTGFAAVYGDTSTVTEPGHEWDRVLRQYCTGERAAPVWGISTADYHEESGAGEILGNFPTVFLVREKSRKAVLEAMAAGRMYAVRASFPQRLVLDTFTVSDSEPVGKIETATLGEAITVFGKPRIRIVLSSALPSDRPVVVRLIREGEVVKRFETSLPFDTEFVDHSAAGPADTYYRLDARGPAGILVANPIFVRRR